MKKVRYYMNARSLLGIVILLVVISIGKFAGNYFKLGTNIYYYVTMPIQMLTYAFVMEENRERNIPVRWEWFAPAFSLMIVGAAVYVSYRAIKYDADVMKFCFVPVSQIRSMGRYISRLALFVSIAAIVLLVLLFVLNKRRKCVFLFSQNLTWLGMYLALSFQDFLHHMSYRRTVTEEFLRIMGILVGEFAVVTLLLFVAYRISRQKSASESVKLGNTSGE